MYIYIYNSGFGSSHQPEAMPFAIRGGGFTQENLCIQRPRQIAEGHLRVLRLMMFGNK